MKKSDFYFDLPEELIAQTPLEQRDHSRLLHLNKTTGEIEHMHFYQLPDLLREGDCLVLNNSRVLPARLIGSRLTGGSVELLGHTMNETNRIPLLRQTGSLIESPSGYLHLTARENLAIVADLKGIAHKDIDRVLEIVHLTADANRKVGQYSLGMKQRLGIAMALLGSPKLLILDEPTNGLDPAGIQEMRSLISSMPETTGATVLISSHLLGEIEQMVTQVGILNHGKMLFEGSLQALQKHSRGGILLRVLDVPKSIAVLNRQGIRAVTQAQHPDVLELPALPDEALAALVSTLAENGVGVVGLTAQTKNLEEIFLSLTQNNGEVA